MIFDRELDFEAALIKKLYTDGGWEPEVLHYKTEEDLIQNWANILFENNRDIDRLNDAPLTRGEMQQILEQITRLRTPVKLNGFINGRSVMITRDNPDDHRNFGKNVSLKIYDRREIAAGSCRYQIAEQPIFTARTSIHRDRRGDFMLLINGMPVIHVELKKSGVSVLKAAEQIKLYAHEGVFSGLFSLIQVFVAMTPDETLYFANPGPDGVFNDDYFFEWADFNNEPYKNWEDIVKWLLTIPMAHMLIGFYIVADNTDGILKVMRSYQYFAASLISNRVKGRKWTEPDQRGGFIWHTTGSGKTLTSFKSAQLIADSGDADKVVFLVDRIELGTQSLTEYRGFADDAEDVQSTENTSVLISKLKSANPADTLIVTSIQKMSRVNEDGGLKESDMKKINKKRIVFIVDEAHRDVFGEMMNNIKDAFPNAMFFGFTGTPITESNSKKMSTTADVFGKELHRYVISDGIRDENVLGFDPTMVMTFPDAKLRKAVALDKAKANSEEEAISDPAKRKVYYKYMDPQQVPAAGFVAEDGAFVKGIEDYVPKAQYEQDIHRKEVVQDICDNWVTLSRGGKFHAILATSSIPEAIEYFTLFKDMAPHLKVTTLYDQSIDGEGRAAYKEDATIEALQRYRDNFGVEFTLANYKLYKKDVSNRLAHKDPYLHIEHDPSKQLNILIVVDQMLTGFDSKWINTLYLDKVLGQERLIQAFSRTNRLFNRYDKPFGIIRYYRYPHTMARYIDEAFDNYSGERPLGLFVDKLEKNLRKLNEIYEEITQLFTAAGVPDFDSLPDDNAEKGKFAKLFREFNAHLEAAIIQDFKWDKSDYTFDHEDGSKSTVTVNFSQTQYLILAVRYKELFSSHTGGGDDDVPYDVDTHLTEINTGAIDKDYMQTRFRKFLKALQEGEETSGVLDELHRSFAVLGKDEQKYADMILVDIQSGNLTIEEGKTLSDYIVEYQTKAHNDRIHRFAEAIGVDEEALREFMSRPVTPENINEYGNFDKLMDKVDRKTARAYFERVEGTSIRPNRVANKIDAILRRFILEGGFDI